MQLSRAESMPARSAISQIQTGPRTQCDQIVSEAMVKACEIVVHGRCDSGILACDGNNSTANHQGRGLHRQTSEITSASYKSNYGTRAHTQTQTQQTISTNSRFNLEIPQVATIRQLLSTHRQNLHTPLRLDVYYEHHSDHTDDTDPSSQPQRELLERYCLNYQPQNNGPISLRTVCKRIVCWVRSLYCLIRMLPAHGYNGVGGKIGYSIYTTDASSSTLPSPSFASKSLSSITTGYGVLSLCVMYDATLLMRSEPIPVEQQQGGMTRQIIKDYHSIALQSSERGLYNDSGNGEKRVMSGLSLVMMGEEENQPDQQKQLLQPGNYSQNTSIDVEENVFPWGSPATRAAFHLPPAYSGEETHNGYGYGYNGAGALPEQFTTGNAESRLEQPSSINGGEGLSISPSPLMSTPPQAIWGRPRKNEGEMVLSTSIVGKTTVEDGDVAPPFTNPTTLQPTPSVSESTSNYTSNFTSSYTNPHPQSLEKSNTADVQRKRTSSSLLLPPVTSLDLLQKSPFSTKKKSPGEESSVLESYREDLLLTSIPRMISANSCVVPSGSSIGASSSRHQRSLLTPEFDNLNNILGGYYSTTGPYSHRFSGDRGHQHFHSNIDAEEMPFAVDDDFPLMSSALSPFGKSSSRSMWANISSGKEGEAAFEGSSVNNMMSSSLAVSALHQRCTIEGKHRLKLFESTTSASGAINNDYATVKDQLSDFRNFGASLMISSSTAHDSCSE